MAFIGGVLVGVGVREFGTFHPASSDRSLKLLQEAVFGKDTEEKQKLLEGLLGRFPQ